MLATTRYNSFAKKKLVVFPFKTPVWKRLTRDLVIALGPSVEISLPTYLYILVTIVGGQNMRAWKISNPVLENVIRPELN